MKKTTKDKFAYGTAIVSFILGWVMCIWGFSTPPPGEVDSSVLWIMGQSLIYTASVLGITNYFNKEVKQFKRGVKKNIEDGTEIFIEEEDEDE